MSDEELDTDYSQYGTPVDQQASLPPYDQIGMQLKAQEATGSGNPDIDAINQTAGNLGIDPAHLTAAMSYETGGKMDPSLWGGTGGRYLGLIQFGPDEQRQYGVRPGQSIPEQMPAVENFLRDRGVRPGMGIPEIYSIINAGSLDRNGQPRWNASDGNGTVYSHVQKIMREHLPVAQQYLNSGMPQNSAQPSPARFAPSVTVDRSARLGGGGAMGYADEGDEEEPGLQQPQEEGGEEVQSASADPETQNDNEEADEEPEGNTQNVADYPSGVKAADSTGGYSQFGTLVQPAAKSGYSAYGTLIQPAQKSPLPARGAGALPSVDTHTGIPIPPEVANPEAHGIDAEEGATAPTPKPQETESPGLLSVAGQAGKRGITQAIQDTADAFKEWHTEKQEEDPSYVGKMLQTPISQGWKNSDWWAAHMAYSLGNMSPALAASIGLGSAGAATPVPGGALIGGAAGFGIMSGLQEIAPAYARARADGLSHEEAVDRAWKSSGISFGFGAAMGLVPGGHVAEATVKQKIGQALSDIFVTFPALGEAQAQTQAALEGKKRTPEQIAEGYATGVATGAVLIGGHRALEIGGKTIEPPGPDASKSEVDDFLAKARGVWSRQEIDEFLRNQEAQRAAREGEKPKLALPAPEGGGGPTEPPGGGGTAPPAPKGEETTPPKQAEKAPQSVSKTDQSVLEQMGFEKDDIEKMSAPERAQHVKDGMESGITPQAGYEDFGRPVQGDGSRTAPAKIEDEADLTRAADRVNTEPSDAQKEAGNYQKGHVRLNGFDISIENPAGSVRKGTGPNGDYESQMPAHYGYIKRSEGADGDHLDVYVAPKPAADSPVYVIDQIDPSTGKFDEHKALMGFDSSAAAQTAYTGSFSDGSGAKRIGAMVELTPDEFKGWVKGGDTTKPIRSQGIGNPVARAKEATPEKPLGAAEDHNRAAILYHLKNAGARETDIEPEVIQRAADIMRDEKLAAPEAFEMAVLRHALEKGALTPEQLDEIYGEGTANELQPTATHERGERDQPTKAAAENGSGGHEQAISGPRPTAPVSEDGERIPRAGEDGKQGHAETTSGEGGEHPAELVVRGGERVAGSGEGTEAELLPEPAKAAEGTDDLKKKEPKKEIIQDAGEKIGGARKDEWRKRGLQVKDLEEMTPTERAQYTTKENVWPRPDYLDLHEKGMTPMAAALLKRLYDRLPTSPPERYGEMAEAKDYITMMRLVRDAVAVAKNEEDMRAIGKKLRTGMEADEEFKGRVNDLIRAVTPPKTYQNPLHLDYNDTRAAERMVREGFPKTEPWQRRFFVREESKYPPYDKNSPDNYKEIGKEYKVYQKPYKFVSRHDTNEEALAAAKAAYEALKEAGGGVALPERPHLDEVSRSGPDYREGRNVDSKDFIKDFGFRAVEFGNWVAGDERQKVVNLAYDALHDLARTLNLPAKAVSLNGTLALAFGARGKGGPKAAAAHYEPGKLVMNMTKINGAGSLAHEWSHALDHYLGELESASPYGGWPKNVTGGRKERLKVEPGNLQRDFPNLARRVLTVMDRLFLKDETNAEMEERIAQQMKRHKEILDSWVRHFENQKKEQPSAGRTRMLNNAKDKIDILQKQGRDLESALRSRGRRQSPSDYYKEAEKISGKGDYWIRPEEMWARAFESYIFDRITQEGLQSQYLVHGVEETRHAGTYSKGNPYPVGQERQRINKAFDSMFKYIQAGSGKLGEATKLEGKRGTYEPEPVEVETPVAKPSESPLDYKAEMPEDTASAQEGSGQIEKALADHFLDAFRDNQYLNILAARRLAKDKGFGEIDTKQVEEAVELGVVKRARELVDAGGTPQEIFKSLKTLYDQQPNLNTRTSTSMRDQAYSTPAPLAYVVGKLAGIDKTKTVYEPTAGNGALLIGASFTHAVANEINPVRADNLKSQGFLAVTSKDAMELERRPGFDVVIANPPFGTVALEGAPVGTSRDFRMHDIQPGYSTTQIDHAIALKALAGMKNDGTAALILGGVDKMLTGNARSDAYNSKAKREFFKVLYDRYNVTDHFTVAGDLYTRQGAGWPVDVITIDGRGKSARALPAVNVPRVLSDWDEIGGLLDARNRVGKTHDQASERDESEHPTGADVGGGGTTGQERVPRSRSAEGQPEAVGGKPVRGERDTAVAGGRENAGAGEPGSGAGRGVADRNGESASAELDSDAQVDAALDAAMESAFGKEEPKVAPQAKTPRTAGEAGKSAVKKGIEGADKAMEGLVQLFGGGKQLGMGINFDPKTYEKAKPHFKEAAEKFGGAYDDLNEFVKKLIDTLKDAYKFTKEMLDQMRPYLKRFIEEVRSGVIKLSEKTHEKLFERTEPKKVDQETEQQVRYTPKSDIGGLGTLVPTNMERSIREALNKLEERVGNIDSFVAKELKYDNPEEMKKAFAAEQMDALALSLDNMSQGKGFIIGDQTGIGKGRVNAGIIRAAIEKGHIPIFVTEKPNLYGDMYRDLSDIGIQKYLGREPRILETNALTEKLQLDEDGKFFLNKSTPSQKADALRQIEAHDFDKKHDMLFTTYDQMNSVDKKDTIRRDLLRRIAPHSVFIFDESHNAGGQSQDRKKKDAVQNRAEFARSLIEKSKHNGVHYSSATYAKRPDVMDLYIATDMGLAVDDPKKLGAAIAHGGVPMQQVVAAMLADAGQYVRREKSFAGIDYIPQPVSVSKDQYDGISHSLGAIQDFSVLGMPHELIERIDKELKAQADKRLGDNSTGGAGANSLNFTSIMHNIVSQMLLSMKSKNAVERALESIGRGEKPVLTVSSTLESFIKDYVDNHGIKPGDPIDVDFSGILKKYLERTRTLIIKKAFSEEKPERRYLTDEELGPTGMRYYNAAKAAIEGLDLKDLPVSPIDHMRNALTQKGHKIGEITGRNTYIDYSTTPPTFRNRPAEETTINSRRRTIAKFNDGRLDGLVLNRAGSTGLSAHASEFFKDQRKRHMIIVQADNNIDTHMQTLGRVNRTGQVVVPSYEQLVADIPAEKRPAAVLAKKMASLNANTTGARSSAITAKDVPDFINEYGDEVAASYVADNPEMHSRLGSPVSISETGKVKREDAMRKLTGRIPLLRLKDQEELYDHLESEYHALLQQMEASGENSLEAKRLDLQAKTLERTEVVPQKGGSQSPFAMPVTIEKASVRRLGKPMKPEEVTEKVMQKLDPGSELNKESMDIGTLGNVFEHIENGEEPWGQQAIDEANKRQTEAIDRFDDYRRELLDEIADPAKQSILRVKLDAVKDRWNEIHEMVNIGARMTIRTSTGNFTGIVTNVEQKGKPKNPLALSTWKVHFAVADAARQLTIPFSQLYKAGKSDTEDMRAIEIEPKRNWIESPQQTLEMFKSLQSDTRQDRYIATGNLLAAYDWLNNKGQIINYTDTKGNVRQGIMTARDFSLDKHLLTKGIAMREPGEIIRWLKQNNGKRMWSKDMNVSLQMNRYSDGLQIEAAQAKRRGGVYYLDKDLTGLTGDFFRRGDVMYAEASSQRAIAAIERLKALGAEFTVTPETPPPTIKVPDEPGNPPELADLAASQRVPYGWDSIDTAIGQQVKRATMERDIRNIIQNTVGQHVTVDLVHGSITQAEPPRGWSGDRSVKTKEGSYKLNARYNALDRLIQVSMEGPNPERSAFHEAWHAFEHLFATNDEMALLEREDARLRDIVKRQKEYTDSEINRTSSIEVRAIAAEKYAYERYAGSNPGAGVHIGIRRLFEKFMRFLRGLRNYFEGHGFKTSEDVFDAFRNGAHEGFSPRPNADEVFGRRAQRDNARAMNFADSAEAPPTRKWNGKVRESIARVLESDAALTLKEKTQDFNARVKRLQEDLEARRETPFGDIHDFYTKKRLYPGRLEAGVKQFNNDHLDPLVKYMQENNVALKEVGDYLYALHAPERNAVIDKINPDMGGEGSGMSDAEAQEIIGRARAEGKEEIFNNIAQRVRAMSEFNLDTMVKAGLESEATVKAWREQYENYVPLSGWEDAPEDAPELVRQARKFNVRGPEVRQAMGRETRAENPLVNMLDQSYRTIDRAERNRPLNAAYLALNSMGKDTVKDIVTFDKGDPKRVIDRKTGLVKWADDSSYRYSPNAVAHKIGGRTHYMVFKDVRLAEAMKRMSPTQLWPWAQGLLTLQNKVKALWTHWSPDFLVRHFLFRYPIEGTLNSFQQKEEGPHSVMRYMKNAVPGLGAASRVIFAENAGREAEGEAGRLQQYYREMAKHGGAMMFRNMRDVDLLKEHLETALMKVKESNIKSLRGRFRAASEAIDVVTNALDNSLRLAAYASARDQGKSPQQAALIAREATIDYQLKGQLSNAIGLWFPFANVATQTGYRMYSRLGRSKTMRRTFMATIAAGLLMSAFNNLVGGTDEDGETYFSKIPEWQKRLHFIILNPFERDAKGRPQAYHIPLPYNWAVPMTMGYVMGDMIFGSKNAKKNIAMMTKSVMEGLTPFGAESTLLGAATPEMARSVTHIETNRDWKDVPVHPDSPWAKGPRSEQSFNSTGDGWRYIASGVNRATGGDKFTPGVFDFHPEDYRETIGHFLGTQISLGHNIYTTGQSLMRGEAPDPTTTPLERVVRGTNYDAADRGSYFEDKASSESAVKRLRAAASDPEGRAILRKEGPQEGALSSDKGGISYSSEKLFKAAQTQLKQLREQEKATTDPEALKDIRERQMQVMNRARAAYKGMQERARERAQ